jgi:hypothetical protein
MGGSQDRLRNDEPRRHGSRVVDAIIGKGAGPKAFSTYNLRDMPRA